LRDSSTNVTKPNLAMTDIDIKLLQVFAEISRTRSVSQAAIHLGLSQPTVSFSLAKLREHFEDPLFVRTPQGMEPTRFAVDLSQRVTLLLASFEITSRYRKSFDPCTARQSFRIAMTDISQIVLLPELLNRLRAIAPGIVLRVMHITENTANMLEAGHADLAIGFMPQLDAGFYQQKLFAQHFVGMAAPEHERIRSDPSLDAFLAEGHVIVTPSGTGHSIVDRTLAQRSLQRRVVLEVPNYLGVANIIAQTDLLATVPLRLAEAIAGETAVRLFALPFEIPEYQVKQHWHGRSHQDPAHKWLRAVLTSLFLESSPGGGKA
jgi:DNA-binding transcriptional LysR family regulator